MTVPLLLAGLTNPATVRICQSERAGEIIFSTGRNLG